VSRNSQYETLLKDFITSADSCQGPPNKELFTLSLDENRLKASGFRENHRGQATSQECSYFIINVNTFGEIDTGFTQMVPIIRAAADTCHGDLHILNCPGLMDWPGHFVGCHFRHHSTYFIYSL